MVNLFLSKLPLDCSVDGAASEIISLLQSLESIVWSVITSGGRYEPRLWFCRTISRIRSVDPEDQREVFVRVLESTPSKREVAAQILRMIFDQRPGKAGEMLARKSHILERFFEG